MSIEERGLFWNTIQSNKDLRKGNTVSSVQQLIVIPTIFCRVNNILRTGKKDMSAKAKVPN